MLLSDLAEGGILRSTSIREHNIEFALLPLDLREEPVEIRSGSTRPPCTPVTSLPISLTAAANSESRRPVMRHTRRRSQPFRRRQTDAAIPTGDECTFPFKLTHRFLLNRHFWLFLRSLGAALRF